MKQFKFRKMVNGRAVIQIQGFLTEASDLSVTPW